MDYRGKRYVQLTDKTLFVISPEMEQAFEPPRKWYNPLRWLAAIMRIFKG